MIDIHTHIIPEHMPDWAEKFGYGGFIRLDHHRPCCARMMVDDKFFREIEDNCWSAETRLKECDHHGVNVQVLSTIPVMFNYWAKPKDTLEIHRFLNDHILEIVHRYPKRFVGLATIPLQDPELAVQELERVMKLGMKGIEIGSHVNDWNLHEKALYPVWEACERLDAAVFVHPWDMMGQEKMSRYWLPWLVGMPAETSLAICSMIFGGIFEKFPKLRVAFSHGGGSFPATVGRIQHGFEARPDLCAIDNSVGPKDSVGKFWFDGLVHDPVAWELLMKLVGPTKIAMGTDYPFPLGELEPGSLVKSMGYDAETTDWLLRKSALEWLNMKEEDFR